MDTASALPHDELALRHPQDAAQAQAMFAHWQAQAHRRGLTLREPPPEPTTCCGRGCNGCVWEGWFGAAWFWQEDARDACLTADAAQAGPVSAP